MNISQLRKHQWLRRYRTHWAPMSMVCVWPVPIPSDNEASLNWAPFWDASNHAVQNGRCLEQTRRHLIYCFWTFPVVLSTSDCWHPGCREWGHLGKGWLSYTSLLSPVWWSAICLHLILSNSEDLGCILTCYRHSILLIYHTHTRIIFYNHTVCIHDLNVSWKDSLFILSQCVAHVI